jgi:hypothetical protein
MSEKKLILRTVFISADGLRLEQLSEVENLPRNEYTIKRYLKPSLFIGRSERLLHSVIESNTREYVIVSEDHDENVVTRTYEELR